MRATTHCVLVTFAVVLSPLHDASQDVCPALPPAVTLPGVRACTTGAEGTRVSEAAGAHFRAQNVRASWLPTNRLRVPSGGPHAPT